MNENESTVLSRQLSLTDHVTSSDSIKFVGGIRIEARTQFDVLIPNANYTISPNPNGSNTPALVIDGGSNDHDGTNNGRAVVTLVPYGPYNITMVNIPTGYHVLGNFTIYTVDNTNHNGTTIFRLVSESTNLTSLGKTVITSSPNLNGTVLSNWKSSFDATKVNGSSSTTIDSVTNLPPILSAGSSNQSQITDAVNSQASVLLKTSYSQNANGSYIIQSLGAPTYSMPKSSSLVSVIPTIIASSSTSSPDQTVTTPPLDKIVPGQQMYIPVQSSVIPSTGGLKLLNIKSNSTSNSTGNAIKDWFVIKTTNTLPSSKPSLPNNDKLTLFVNVTYQYETNGVGFNWGKPSNFASAPKMTLQLPKNPSGVTVDSNGCPVSDIFVFDPSHNSWTTNPVTILSSTPTSGNSNSCDVIVQTQHFSQFALGSHTSSSTSSTPGTSTTSSQGGGTGTGVGVGVGTSTSTTSNGGGAGPYLKIQKISYDVCDKQIVRIQVATDYNGTDPMVLVRTSLTGVVDAKLVPDQPYAQENINATVRKLVYEASINPKETSFEVVAIEAIGHNIFSVGKTVEVTGCNEDLDFTQVELLTQPTQIDLAAPKIFDLKFQVGNGTKQLASEPTTQFVSGKPLSVYAIVDTPTSITTSELRFTEVDNSDTSKYHTITMNVTPLQISNSTYLLSATVPSELLQAPGVQYWVHVENSANKKIDSDVSTIGVKPNYPINAKLELDVSQNRAAGTTAKPSSYITNDGNPVYGTISLVVDGKTVYTSPGQLFSKGQTQVRLEWKTQPTDGLVNHKIEAIANIYDKSFIAEANIITFSSIKTESITQPINITPINDTNGHAVANPQVLYSSFNNEGTMRYKVTAPDGTCVIGAASECLVTNSTLDEPGQIKSITVGDQVYRVRYSGMNDTLERFSITSVDPIIGTWKIEIDSQIDLSPQTHVMDSVSLKVIYRPVEIPFLSE
jgi:hypothetical protein